MDPITQGVLGATLSESFSNKRKVKAATALGCLGGFAPDIDVLFQSPSDPLIFLEFHRGFTHSLIFIPVGALICALLAWRFSKDQFSFKETWLYCFLGYATHGLLDACTTYGTQLFWPFSNIRVAWNTISIVDPLFTLPLIMLVFLGVRKRAPLFGRLALAWVAVYLSLGLMQRDRAIEAGIALANDRGHTPVRLEANPGFGNLVLWKVMYETNDKFYVDAIRVGLSEKVFPGDSIDKLDIKRHFPWLDSGSQQAQDIERFRWFANSYLAVDKNIPNRIVDIRYSILPNTINALWAINLDPAAKSDAHVQFSTNSNTSVGELSKLLEMLFY